MDAANVLINNISTNPVSYKSDASTKTTSKVNTNDFKNILTSALNSDNTIQQVSDDNSNIAEMVAKFLKGDCSLKDLSSQLDNLSDDELTQIKNLLESINQIISQEISSGNKNNQSLSNILSGIIVADKDDESKDNSLANQLLAYIVQMLQAMVTDNNTDTENVSQVIQSILPVQTDSKKDTQSVVIPVETVNTDSINDNVTKEASAIISNENIVNTEVTDLKPVEQLTEKISALSDLITAKQNGDIKAQQMIISSDGNASVKSSEINENTDTSVSDLYKQISSEINSANKISQKSNDVNSELSEITAALGNTSGTQTTQITDDSADALPVNKQIETFIKTDILPTVKNGETKELTMMLNPEELGKISVKISKTEGQIMVSIAAQNSLTSKLIEDKLPTLVTNLKNDDITSVDVKVVTPNQNASEFMNHFGFSNQSNNHNSNHSNFKSDSVKNVHSDSQAVAMDQTPEFIKEAKLWQTA